MGTMTHAELVTEAVELAGNTGLSTRAQKWLGLVLRHLSELFTLPQQEGVSALIGVTPTNIGSSIQVGGATGDAFAGLAVRGVRKVLIASAEFATAGTDWTELERFAEPTVTPDVFAARFGNTGRPVAFVIAPNRDGFEITLLPNINRGWAVLIVADAIGTSINAYSASVVNLYPNDMTVLQGVFALCLKHQQDERAASEWKLFEKMASDDRIRYGNMNGNSTKLMLKSTTFSPRKRRGSPWDWMGPK